MDAQPHLLGEHQQLGVDEPSSVLNEPETLTKVLAGSYPRRARCVSAMHATKFGRVSETKVCLHERPYSVRVAGLGRRDCG